MTRISKMRCLAATVALLAIAACAKSKGAPGQVNVTVKVSGTALDSASSSVLASATVKTVGLLPELSVTADADGKFTFAAVPINGYVILSVSAASHQDTLNPALLVEEQDVNGVSAFAVSDANASALLAGFGVVGTSGRGQVLGRVNFATGQGIAGIQTIQFLPLTFTADGPHFLDLTGAPAPGAAATSSSGGFTFFNVSTGNIAIQASAPNFLFQPVVSVARAGTWSIVSVEGSGGTPGSTPTPTPTGTPATVSFSAQVFPIFTSRGCTTCHRTGNPPGGMRLDRPAATVYTTITTLSGVVNLGDPAASLLLKKPLFEAAPDHGGGNIFLTTSDPDYVTILNWITQGANNN